MDLSTAAWRKSSLSGPNGGQCVEVAVNLPDTIALRDSKNPNGPKLLLTPAQWHIFTESIKTGRFDQLA